MNKEDITNITNDFSVITLNNKNYVVKTILRSNFRYAQKNNKSYIYMIDELKNNESLEDFKLRWINEQLEKINK